MTSKLVLHYIDKNSSATNELTEIKDETVEMEELNVESETLLGLPKWLLKRPELAFQQQFIQKGQILGSGHYGTVFKGTLMQGNAV